MYMWKQDVAKKQRQQKKCIDMLAKRFLADVHICKPMTVELERQPIS